MFSIFFKIIVPKTKIIFIVEDNELYAKSLNTFLKIRFPKIKEVKTFRIGEMCLMEMHRNPRIVIIDYFLNSKYEQANNGLEIIKSIKILKPKTDIIVLSIQKNYNIITEAVKQYGCSYVHKDQWAFNKVEKLINENFNHPTAGFEPRA